ncbi:hypothetical protein JCM3775_003785 [Rhodotorula graminis]
MGSTHDPQPPCHIDRLPVELLEEILRPHAPPRLTFIGNGPPIQEPPVLAAHAVSKRWSELGTPLQWRDLDICIEPGAEGQVVDVDAAFIGRPGVAQACRTLWFTNMASTRRSMDMASCAALLIKSARTLVNVEELVLNYCPRVDLQTLSAFHNLRRLHVVDTDLETSAFPTPLRRLESLSFGNSTFWPPSTLAPDTRLPALRHLSIDTCGVAGATAVTPPLFCDAFLGRLEYIQLEASRIEDVGEVNKIVEHPPRDDLVLLRVRLGEVINSPRTEARHVRVELYIFKDHGYPGVKHLQDLRRMFASFPKLRLALVPKSLWHLPARASDAARRERALIIADAASRAFDIRSYATLSVRNAFSPEFSTWLREEAARRAADA